MTIETQYFNRVVLITVEGRIDATNNSELEDEFSTLFEEAHYNIVTDLSAVDFMNSRGLRAMVAALRDCREKGGDIRIANPLQRMCEVLKIGTANTLFAIYDDAVSAVGSF